MTTDLRERDAGIRAAWLASNSARILLATPLGSALIVAVAQICVIWVHLGLMHYRVSDFIQIGQRFGRPLNLNALTTTRIGYDGQFFYFMARFSGHLPAGAVDFPALRYSRIFYPALVRVLSLGNVAAIPWVMLFVNVTAIAGTTACLSWLISRLGGPPWIALVVGLYCGQALAVLRDVSDPIAVFFAALALVGVARRRWILVAVALGLGMLDRETTVLFVLCCAVPLLREQRWRMLVSYATLTLLPYLVWQFILHSWLGSWGWQQTTKVNTFLPLPFAGLAGAQSVGYAAQMFLFACVPALIAIAAGILVMRRRPWDDPLALVVAPAAILYGVALILQPSVHWQDIWEPYRLAAPIPLLLPILFCILKPAPTVRRAWYAVFACLAYSFLTTLIA